MSKQVTTDVKCDYPSCDKYSGSVTTNGKVAYRAARREAKSDGWTVFRGNDYCRKHSAYIRS